MDNEIYSIINTLKKLVSIPSHSGDEKKIAQYIYEEARQNAPHHDIVVQRYSEKGRNVLVLAKEPRLLIDVHLDTVPLSNLKDWESHPFLLRESRDKLIGLGSLDDKAGIAICLELMKNVDCSRVTFSFCGNEETDVLGLKCALEKRLLKNIPEAIVMEPTSLNVACTHKGAGVARIVFTGIAAHASDPSLGDNAIEKAAKYIQYLKEMFPQLAQMHDLLGKNTYCVGLIKGGNAVNIVPSTCEIQIDFRFLPNQGVNDIKQMFQKAAEKIDDEIMIKFENVMPPMEFRGSRDIFDGLLEVTKGREIGTAYWAHSGLLQAHNIPSIVFGPGDITDAHACNESISKNEIGIAYRAIKHVLQTTLCWDT